MGKCREYSNLLQHMLLRDPEYLKAPILTEEEPSEILSAPDFSGIADWVEFESEKKSETYLRLYPHS